jgi:hypothetical protein
MVMAGLVEKVLEFLKDVSDVNLRDGVLQSITFLRDVYRDNKADAEQILADLKEICHAVLSAMHPDWDEAMIREEAENKAREFLRYIGVETLADRMRAKYRSPLV